MKSTTDQNGFPNPVAAARQSATISSFFGSQCGALPRCRHAQKVLPFLLAAFACSTHAGHFSVDWWTVAGGAVNCADPHFSAVGTTGQSDATAMRGATRSVEGGFWNSTTTLQQLLDQVTGVLELEAFVGSSRSVTFKATDGNSVVLKAWKVSLAFAGGSVASYALTNVPLATVSLSAKTDWNLRRKLGVSFVNNAAVANFTGSSPLPAGDLDGSNTVDLGDYFILAGAWYTSNPAADIDGSGWVDLDDYFLLSTHWQETGDPE